MFLRRVQPADIIGNKLSFIPRTYRIFIIFVCSWHFYCAIILQGFHGTISANNSCVQFLDHITVELCFVGTSVMLLLKPVSIQMQSLALHALRK